MRKSFMNNFRWLVTLLAGLVIAVPVTALRAAGAGANLDVQVMDIATGAALSHTAVCLGTAAAGSQFGSLVTDERGMVRFRSVPPSPLQVTVSRPGYQAERRELEPVFEDRMLVLKLASGWRKGPACTRVSGVADSVNRLKITGLDLGVTAQKPAALQVRTQVQGDAGQIRVSSSPDFSDASWQPYKASVNYSPGSARQLYVQVRRYTKIQGATLQSLSPVATVRLREAR